jgi:hypothetical protein
MAWCSEDETTAAAEKVLDQAAESSVIVPSIWRFALGNALQMAMRCTHITEIFRDKCSRGQPGPRGLP